jgi:hypothetical protein
VTPFGLEDGLQLAQGFIDRMIAGLMNDSVVGHGGFSFLSLLLLDVRLHDKSRRSDKRLMFRNLQHPIAYLYQGWSFPPMERMES